MTRGGKRSGAGRKRGSLSRKTRVIAERAAVDGITPLEVILRTMRSAWARASSNGETVVSFQDALIAAAMAEKAAPYVHPRLAAEKHEVSGAEGKPLSMPMPQVVIYLPDNGRDPDLVKPIPACQSYSHSSGSRPNKRRGSTGSLNAWDQGNCLGLPIIVLLSKVGLGLYRQTDVPICTTLSRDSLRSEQTVRG